MPTENIGENSLLEVAKAASIETGMNIELAPRKDSSVGWLCTNAHPLRELETIHQKAVRKAGRAHPAGSDLRMEAEHNSMKQFYLFHALEPALLEEGEPVKDQSAPARFASAEKQLSAIDWELRNSSPYVVGDPDYFARIRNRLLDLLLEFDKIQSSFVNFPEHGNFQNANVPILLKAEDSLYLWRAFLNDQALAVNDLKTACQGIISDVQNELSRAVEGLTKISMIFTIEPFYLFRLLVPFRIVSNLGVSLGDKRGASGTLTGLINNNNQLSWISMWLESKIIELDDALMALDPNHDDLIFHLKGGRAQACLLQDPGSGSNDWDTGIVINPDLPAEYWHATFNKVHNIVLNKLRKFKQEFFMLLHLHADEVTIEMVRNRSEEEDDLLSALELSNVFSDPLCDLGDEQGSCKAELIDIGIPRRDSIEAFEHWYHTGPHITRHVNDLPIPGHLYYIDEYLAMIRQTFAGVSPNPYKTSKRIRRLFQIMNLNNPDDPMLDDLVVEVRNEIEGPLFPLSLGVLDQPAQPQYITRLIPVLLKQFMDAYDFRIEAGLAPLFDSSFNNTSTRIPGLAIPADVQNGINNDAAWNPATHNTLLQWIALAGELSQMFELNLRDRAEFFGFGQQANPAQALRRRTLETFVKALYTASVFAQDENDLEVRFAVCGSFAAYLHAGDAQLETELNEELDPVARIELKIFCRHSNADPDTVRDALILPAVNTYVSNPANPIFNVETGPGGAIYNFWPSEETLGHFHYHPLMVRIRVDTDFWPQQPAFVRGFPVLSLRDLIREYDRLAAHAGEWGRVQRLKATSGVLRDLLTRFDY